MQLDRSEAVKILKNVKIGEISKILDFRVDKNVNAVGYLGDYYNLTIRYWNVSTIISLCKQPFRKDWRQSRML